MSTHWIVVAPALGQQDKTGQNGGEKLHGARWCELVRDAEMPKGLLSRTTLMCHD